MKRRPLGNSGMNLPELTLGTWLTFSTAHQDTANALVAAAFDAGIDAFDTADVYGMGDGERALAAALRGRPSPKGVGSQPCRAQALSEEVRPG